MYVHTYMYIKCSASPEITMSARNNDLRISKEDHP